MLFTVDLRLDYTREGIVNDVGVSRGNNKTFEALVRETSKVSAFCLSAYCFLSRSHLRLQIRLDEGVKIAIEHKSVRDVSYSVRWSFTICTDAARTTESDCPARFDVLPLSRAFPARAFRFPIRLDVSVGL